eukprot:6023105-Prymnesium_polylepis.1
MSSLSFTLILAGSIVPSSFAARGGMLDTLNSQILVGKPSAADARKCRVSGGHSVETRLPANTPKPKQSEHLGVGHRIELGENDLSEAGVRGRRHRRPRGIDCSVGCAHRVGSAGLGRLARLITLDLHRLRSGGARRRAPRQRNRVEGEVVDLEVAHLEGRAQHGRLERAALGDALVKIERLGAFLAKERRDAGLHSRDAHAAAEDLDGGDVLLGDAVGGRRTVVSFRQKLVKL